MTSMGIVAGVLFLFLPDATSQQNEIESISQKIQKFWTLFTDK